MMAQTLPPDAMDAANGVRIAPEGDTDMAALAYAHPWTDDAPEAPTPSDAALQALAQELARRQPAEQDPTISDDECDRRIAHSGEVVQAMMEVPAEGLAGLQAKAKAAVWCVGDRAALAVHAAEPETTFDQVMYSILNDLLADHMPKAETDDGAIRRAAGEFLALREEWKEASHRHQAAWDAATVLYPEVPTLIRNFQRPTEALSRAALQQMDANAQQLTWPRPQGSPRVEAYDHWTAQKAAIDSSFGIPGLDDAVHQAEARMDDAADRIVEMSPATIQEAAAKYGVLLAHYASDGDEQIVSAPVVFFRFMRDLQSLAASNH